MASRGGQGYYRVKGCYLCALNHPNLKKECTACRTGWLVIAVCSRGCKKRSDVCFGTSTG